MHLPNGALITAIPEALRQRPQWVLWRLDLKDGELTKVPYSDVQRKARANDPKTWLSFDRALQRWQENPSGWAGIGYEFSADDPYTGIDLDSCLDPTTGRVADWADAELALLLPTYAEISPSGTGIKLIIQTERIHTLGSGKDKSAGQVEVYSRGRFFAITGNAFEDAPPTIAQVDDALIEQIIAREQQRRGARKPAASAAHDTRPNGLNGAYPPLHLPQLAHVLEQLHPDRWAAYDDWLRIGMALHHWADGDAHRMNTARSLFDQYSKERAPEAYGQVEEKWISFGKRDGQAPDVTVGTLIRWAREDTEHNDPPHPAEAIGEEEAADIENPAPIAVVASFPELPEAARIDDVIGTDACPWLDEYIAFSRRWSPQSYDGFHEACGLWVLATVAARRVMLPFGGDKFTPLYTALCARTSIWAKSTAANIAKETITAVGLSQLLAPDISTPQAFLRRLAERIPADYGKESPEAQALHQAALAFAGQRGWWHEEFGTHLAGMMREGGAMADFRGHLRILDDCPPSYAYDTVGHGLTIIKRPYLALLANLTPADLAPFARKGGALWGDGYFARFAFVTPPAGAERSHERFPDGWRIIPPSLTRPLRAWHEQLGIPEVEITERLDDNGKRTGEFQLIVTPVDPRRCALGAGVVDAFYRYREALIDLVDASDNHDLDGSYTRFAEKALRVAMLLASLSNSGRIEIEHWARAQQIAERWRASLHHLIDQLGQSEDSPDRILEDKINRLFTRHPALTAREAGRYLHISTGEAERMLDQLVKGGALQAEAGKRTKRYRPTAASVTSVTVSHMSHPAQNCDTSQASPKGVEEVSQNFSSSDRSDIVTVATLPDFPSYALWHNAGHDEPVTVTGVAGEQDGVLYLTIDGSQARVPAYDVEFFTDDIPIG